MFTPRLRDDVTRVKAGLSVFYSSLGVGELARLRTNLLNHFRKCNHPVGVLITDGFQVESGHLVVSTHGPNAPNLGAATVYNEEGTVMDEYVLPIAGKTVDAVPQYAGENLYSSKQVHRRTRGMAVPRPGCRASAALVSAVDMDGARSFVPPYAAESDSMSDFDRGLPDGAGGDGSDIESVSSSASYAVRLEATRKTAAAGSPGAHLGSGAGRGAYLTAL
jgi:hypothetical protein